MLDEGFLLHKEENYIRCGLVLNVYGFSLAVFFFFFFFFLLLGLHLQHMEVPRLRVKSERQLPACSTAIAMQDSGCICNLYCSWIPSALSKARDRTHILMDASQVQFCCATTGTPFFMVSTLSFFLLLGSLLCA